MKIKALIDCNGIGYENFKADEIREVENNTAEVLVSFGYAVREDAREDEMPEGQTLGEDISEEEPTEKKPKGGKK